MNKDKRSVEILVISDTHLGTKGCRSRELLAYLKSVEPKTLILNGDIIDIWQFRKNYWPSSHMKILKYIIGLAARKTTVYYITGNHDEVMRRFNGTSIGNVHIVNQLIMEVGGEKTWFFHGDVFDVIMKNSKWLARLGSVSYDTLILINTIINRLSQSFGRGPVSLSKKIKNNVKSAVKHINNFEVTAAQLAFRKGYEVIVCGHIHHPEIRTIHEADQSIVYMNSGDWIENLTALEFNNGCWTIYHHLAEEEESVEMDGAKNLLQTEDLKAGQLFELMLKEFEE